MTHKNLTENATVQVDGKFYKKCSIVMISNNLLKTNSTTEIYLNKKDNSLNYGFVKDKYDYNQHIYILSNEEIKEGDWYYNTVNKTIQEASDYDARMFRGLNHNCKKIIATTDTNVCKSYMVGNELMIDGYPRPSNEFIKKYCELNGIWEVLVEYTSDSKYIKVEEGEYPIGIHSYKLKIAPDNTITIKRIKDSWDREEVEILLKRAFGVAKSTGCYLDGEQVKGWIKQNL